MKWFKMFYFPKSDRVVVVFLLVFVLVGFLLLFVSGGGTSLTETDSSDSISAAFSPRGGRDYDARRQAFYYGQYSQPQSERFDFDPNTADSTQLLRLGLRPWMVRNIYKYRSRGGVFRRVEDFAKVYGLTKTEFEELRPHIKISQDFTPAALAYGQTEHLSSDTLRYSVKLKPQEQISLNATDTAVWQRVPGIGSYYARQVVRYQQRLGGFYKKEQLLEIDGFPEEALAYIADAPGATQCLQVNKLTLNQLKRHPYINFYQARAIMDYRRLYGSLKTLEDLRLLNEFSDTDIERLQYYLSF